MTTTWTPTLLQDNFKLPETVDEAVDRLMMVLDDEQKIALIIMQEDDLINLHFSLGIAIRNAFGLHHVDSNLLASCDIATHPDDVSEVIIKALWEQLKSAGNPL